MQCPECYGKTHVYDTRIEENELGEVLVRRRRQCLECGHRFKTTEIKDDGKQKGNEVDQRSATESQDETGLRAGPNSAYRKG